MTTNGMETVDDFLGPRLGLRSSRVTSNSTYGDQDEREQLIPSSDENNYRNVRTIMYNVSIENHKLHEWPKFIFKNARIK